MTRQTEKERLGGVCRGCAIHAHPAVGSGLARCCRHCDAHARSTTYSDTQHCAIRSPECGSRLQRVDISLRLGAPHPTTRRGCLPNRSSQDIVLNCTHIPYTPWLGEPRLSNSCDWPLEFVPCPLHTEEKSFAVRTAGIVECNLTCVPQLLVEVHLMRDRVQRGPLLATP